MIRKVAYVSVIRQNRINTYQVFHITPTSHVPYHHTASIILNSPLLTCRFHRFMRYSIPVHVLSLNSNELIRSGNVFPVINSPMSVLMVQDKIQSFVSSSHQGYTSGCLAKKAYIDDTSLDNLLDDPSG